MNDRSYHAPSATDLRQRSILNFVRTQQQATRADIAEATNMSSSMVVRLVAELVGLGLLSQADERPDAGRPGRPSDSLRLNPQAGYGIGVEFGRDTLTTVITDAVGALVQADQTHPVPPFVAEATTGVAMAATIERAAHAAGIDLSRVEALGIALHDIVDAHGAWGVKGGPRRDPYPIRNHLESLLGIPTVVEDVSRAFAEAEFRFGAGRNVLDMAYIFIGRHGVGSGIFVNGSLLRSSSGVCGEIGHVIVDNEGALCVCGSLGCLETVALHDAVVQRYQNLLDQGVAVVEPLASPLTFSEICAAAGRREKAAGLVLDDLARAVGIAIASVVSVAGTPNIVIGGDLVHAGDPFIHELLGTIRRRVITSLASQLTVEYAQLPAYAGAQGAAFQAVQAAWTNGLVFERAVQRQLTEKRAG